MIRPPPPPPPPFPKKKKKNRRRRRNKKKKKMKKMKKVYFNANSENGLFRLTFENSKDAKSLFTLGRLIQVLGPDGKRNVDLKM